MHSSSIKARSTFLPLIGLLALVCGTAAGQNYPVNTVKIIVPFPAGGVADTMARLVSQNLSESWGQSVIVENRPGAAQVSGVQAVTKSAPDGYTLLVTADTTVTANPLLYKKLPYDPAKELTPIIGLCDITPVLAINPKLPFKSVQDLIVHAKANPGKLTYGSAGIGTYLHLSMEEIKQRTGTSILHVPYKGAAPAINALVSGDISMMLINIGSVAAHEKAGKIRILAVAGKTKPASRPSLPMVADYGLPGFATGSWFGMFGPAKMPPALVARIHADVDKALSAPKTRQFFETHGFVRIDKTPAEFAQLIQDDLKHWGALIRATGATLD